MATAEQAPANPAQRIGEVWQNLSMPNRVLLFLVLVALLIAVMLMFRSPQGTTGIGKSPLLSGYVFSIDERNNALRAFQAAELSDYLVDGDQILVPRNEANRYLAALSRSDALPGNFYRAFDDYIKNQQTWWASRTESERLFRVAKQRNLAAVIAQFDEVESATVHVTEPPQIGLRRQGKAKASVSIAMRGKKPLDPLRQRQIRELVAGAFSELEPENVAVVGNTQPSGDGSDEFHAGIAKLENKYLQSKAAYADFVKKTVEGLVDHYPGASVVVNVEVDATKGLQSKRHYSEKGPILKSESSDRSSGSSEGSPAGGVPGTRTNVDPPGQPPNVGATAAATNTETDSTSNQVFDNIHEDIISEKQDFIPQRVGVVINIPESYRMTAAAPGAAAATPTPAPTDGSTPAATPKVNEQELTANVLALNFPGMTDETSVKINWVPDTAVPPAQVVPSDLYDTLMKYWLSIVLLIFGIAAVVLATIIVARSPRPEALIKPAFEGEPAEEPEEEEPLPSMIQGSEVKRYLQIKEGVTEFIHKDPDIAASLIRRWVQET